MKSSKKGKGEEGISYRGSQLQRRIKDVDATAHLRREIPEDGSSSRLTLTSEKSEIHVPEYITVYFTPEKLFIRSQSLDSCVVVDRQDESIRVDSPSAAKIPSGTTKRIFFGLLGQIALFGSTYLIVISQRRRVGREAEHPIWKLTGVNFLRVRDERVELSEEHERMNSRVIYLLIELLTNGHFIFAYSFDFTHTVQRYHSIVSPDNLSKPVYTRGDHRFIWNDYLTEKMLPIEGLASYLVPLTRGFCSSNKFHLNGQEFSLILVSRVSVTRPGVRYFTRGLDSYGHVGNFVETEMIVDTPKDRFSFVQTRSSPPLFWDQRPDLSSQPKPRIRKRENNVSAFTQHFDIQCKIYGPHVLLDILDRFGIEGYIADFYSHLVVRSGSNRVKYVAIPFEGVSQVLSSLEEHRVTEDLNKYGFVTVTGGRKILSTQKGIIRTTGFDSVDRTNLVQCVISSIVFRDMLIKSGVFKKNDELEYYGKIKKSFYETWGDNGDTLSQIYCGSPSLTSDRLRFSSSPIYGAVKSWAKHVTRYYASNFCHGDIQDGIGVLTGQQVPTELALRQRPRASLSADINEAIADDSDSDSFLSRYVTSVLPICLAFTVSNFFVFIIQAFKYGKSSLLCSIVWLGVTAVVLAVTVKFLGRYFVNTPKFMKRHSRRY